VQGATTTATASTIEVATETKPVETSVYDRTSVTKTQITAAGSAEDKSVVVTVDSDSDKNRVSLSKAAVSTLATDAESLTVVCSGQTILFDQADLQKLAKVEKPVYLYVTPTTVTAKYKNDDGKMVTIKNVGEPQGVVTLTSKKVSTSSYNKTTRITSPKVKTAYTEVANTSQIITVSIASTKEKQKVEITAAAAKRLSKYANGLTILYGDQRITLSKADLKKIAKIGDVTYLYLNGSTAKAVYLTDSGASKTILKKTAQ
jgi:hypothetical protein